MLKTKEGGIVFHYDITKNKFYSKHNIYVTKASALNIPEGFKCKISFIE